MVLVWLVGRWGKEDVWRVYQDGRRITFSSVLKHLSVSESTGALQLLDERLARCGLTRMTCDDVEGRVLAVLDVVPETIPDGVLGRLSLEQRLAWLLSNRADMAFNSIEAVVPLQVPVKATVVGHTLKASRQIFQLQVGFADGLGAKQSFAGNTVREELRQGNLLPAGDMMPVIAVQVWRPIASLISRGLWSDFSLPKGVTMNLRTPQVVTAIQSLINQPRDMDWGRQAGGSSSSHSLQPMQFREWADAVRSWADSFAPNTAAPLDPESLRLSMELMVSTFEGYADSLEAVSRGRFDCKQFGIHRYDLVFLIRCLFLCSSLRSDAALRDAFIGSLHVLFKGGMGGEANYFIEILEDRSFPLPSPATLGHMRFVLDCVLMHQKRQYHTELFRAADTDTLPALFFLLDSSPQGNVNWLMIEYFLVEAILLQDLCKGAWGLQQLGSVQWEDDPDEDRVCEERTLVEQLAGYVQHHILPPVGLGSGRSDLQHELHAFLHALFLETGDFELMRIMAQATTAISTDKGTEAGIQQAPPISLSKFLCFAQGQQFIPDGGDDIGAEELCLDFSSSLGIHALQHFVNNCTKGIADAMPSFWEDIYPGMNALLGCLRAKFFRQRFSATCLDIPAGKPWVPKFEEGCSADLVGWRFGSLAACNRALLSFETPLRCFWDDDKLNFKRDHQQPQQPQQQQQAPLPGQQPRPHSQKPEGPNTSLASQACKSRSFWAWQHMFARIANVVAHMVNWLQSCPCHTLSETTWGARASEFARRLFMDRRESAHCPLTGFRAAEVACGQFSAWVQAIADIELAEVSLGLEGCSASERAQVLGDLQAARQHVVFAVQAELACWEMTPRVFCGLSHFDETAARSAVSSGFRQWWAMPDDEKARAHPLTRRFCEEGPLNSELLDFLNGSSRQQLPLLMQEAGRLLLVPVNEVSVERLHAQTHKQLKRSSHAGAVAISWAHRSKKFLQQLSSDAKFLKNIASRCCACYHPLKLIPSLGLATHPGIAPVIASTFVDATVGRFELLGNTKAYDKMAKQIVYHLDLASQFLPTDYGFNKKPGGSGRPGPDRGASASLQDLQLQLLLEKFRHDHTPGTWYTIKKTHVAESLVADSLPAFRVNRQHDGMMFEAVGIWLRQLFTMSPSSFANHPRVSGPQH